MAANNDGMRSFWLTALLALPAWAAPALQPLIDATPIGGTLRPAAGVYAGFVRITMPPRSVRVLAPDLSLQDGYTVYKRMP